jgi:hypothetical protein
MDNITTIVYNGKTIGIESILDYIMNQEAPISKTKSLNNNSIAWGWGQAINEHIKGIESICNEIINNKDLNAIMSTEGSGAIDAIKKVISWIIEKLKSLLNIIREFFGRIKKYMDDEKHRKLSSTESINLALEELKHVISSFIESDLVNSLTQDRVLMAYYNARQFSKLFSQSSFEKSFDDFMVEIKNIVSNNYNAGTSEDISSKYDGFKEAIVDEIEKIKELSRDSVEKIQNDRKNTKYMGDSHPAILVIKYYKVILFSEYLIRDKFITVLEKSIDRQNSILKEIERSMSSQTGENNKDFGRVTAIKAQVSLMSSIINSLLGLNISQAAPTIDRAIAELIRMKQIGNSAASEQNDDSRKRRISPDLLNRH